MFTTCVLTVIVGVSKLCKEICVSYVVNNVDRNVMTAFRTACERIRKTY